MARIYLSLRTEAAIAARARLAERNPANIAPPSVFDDIHAAYSADTPAAEPCTRCGRTHDALWTIRRVARDSGLYWPFVQINGKRVLLDASLPTTVDRLPRDARPVDAETAARLWHDDNESHTFGGPNVAAALRASIAEHNASVGR
jgi:hypothetical protein